MVTLILSYLIIKYSKFKGFKNGPNANLEILQDSSLKIMTEGSVGFAEDFIENKIRTSNPSELMYYFALNNEHIEEKNLDITSFLNLQIFISIF